MISVAILTTETFNASTVNPTTIHFGATGTEAAPVQSDLEDVDGDGDIDMILHFKTNLLPLLRVTRACVSVGRVIHHRQHLDGSPILGAVHHKVIRPDMVRILSPAADTGAIG